MYHSSLVARDRDRLRQQVLEGLGWKIHRIWSTDWTRDRRGALERLMERVRALAASSGDLSPTGGDASSADSRVVDQTPGSALKSVSGNGLSLAPRDDPYLGVVGTYDETPSGQRSRNDFYDSPRRVGQDIALVVNHEGPIHEDLVAQRVARMYGLMRTGERMVDLIRAQIIQLTSGSIRRRGSWLWPADGDSVNPRRPVSGVKLRDASHVPPEELEAAARLVCQLTRGAKLEQLVPEIGRVLGYGRTGSDVAEAATNAVQRLVVSGTLVDREGVFGQRR
ncbi:MAG: hypothetical protein HW416_2090 [Chloroflexi bacterium]|nr:hypothetical protein [Chloroflexota bacterium]